MDLCNKIGLQNIGDGAKVIFPKQLNSNNTAYWSQNRIYVVLGIESLSQTLTISFTFLEESKYIFFASNTIFIFIFFSLFHKHTIFTLLGKNILFVSSLVFSVVQEDMLDYSLEFQFLNWLYFLNGLSSMFKNEDGKISSKLMKIYQINFLFCPWKVIEL